MTVCGSFNPCDATGAIIRKPSDEVEFLRFLNWLNDDSAETVEEKNLAFSHFTDVARDVHDSKARFVETVSRPFLSSYLADANDLARYELSEPFVAEDTSILSGPLSDTRKLLAHFLGVVSEQIFDHSLRGAKVPEGATDAVKDCLRDGSRFCHDAFAALGGLAGSAFAQVLRARFETAAARAELARLANDRPPVERESLGDFAPLVLFFEERLNPSVKAELAGRLEDHARSGWLQHDLLDCVSEKEESHTPAALKLRALYKQIQDEPTTVDPDVFLETLLRREDEIFIRVAIDSQTDPISGKILPNNFAKTFAEYKKSGQFKIEGGGVADSVCIAKNGALLITFATSAEVLLAQNDQWCLTIEGLRDMLSKKAIPNASGELIPRVLHKSITTDDKGQAGRKLLDFFPDSDFVRIAANTLPFLRQLALGNTVKLPPEDWKAFSLDLVGAKEIFWGDMQRRLVESNAQTTKAQREEALVAVSGFLEKLFGESAKQSATQGLTLSHSSPAALKDFVIDSTQLLSGLLPSSEIFEHTVKSRKAVNKAANAWVQAFGHVDFRQLSDTHRNRRNIELAAKKAASAARSGLAGSAE